MEALEFMSFSSAVEMLNDQPRPWLLRPAACSLKNVAAPVQQNVRFDDKQAY